MEQQITLRFYSTGIDAQQDIEHFMHLLNTPISTVDKVISHARLAQAKLCLGFLDEAHCHANLAIQAGTDTELARYSYMWQGVQAVIKYFNEQEEQASQILRSIYQKSILYDTKEVQLSWLIRLGMSDCFLNERQSVQKIIDTISSWLDSIENPVIKWDYYILAGVFYNQLMRDPKQALLNFETGFQLARDTGWLIQEGKILSRIAAWYVKWKEWSKVINLLVRSIQVKRETQDLIGEGYSLNSLAGVYRTLHEYDREVYYLNLWLEVRRKAYKEDSPFIQDTELALERALIYSVSLFP